MREELSPALAKVLRETIEHRDKEQLRQLQDAQIRLNSGLWEKGGAYTNLVVAVGYAGYFGLMSVASPILDKREVLWSAFWMGISLLFFVAFEIVKMWVVSGAASRASNTVIPAKPYATPAAFLQALEKFDQQLQYANLWTYRLWRPALLISCSTALASIGILLVGLMRHAWPLM